MLFRPLRHLPSRTVLFLLPVRGAPQLYAKSSRIASLKFQKTCFFEILGQKSAPAGSDEFIVAHTGTAEDVEGATDGGVDGAVGKSVDEVKVGQGRDAAGVGHGAAAPGAEHGNEFVVDTAAAPFDIGRVDEELVAAIGEGRESGGGDGQFGEGLPAVHGHDPAISRAAAAEVEHDSFAPHALYQFTQYPAAEVPLAVE